MLIINHRPLSPSEFNGREAFGRAPDGGERLLIEKEKRGATEEGGEKGGWMCELYMG